MKKKNPTVIRWERGDEWYQQALLERRAASGGRGGGTGRAWKHDEWAVPPPQVRPRLHYRLLTLCPAAY